ncbi:MAG TPA: DUF1810 domain-containing protein [Hymenobacter sp.]
MSTAAPLQRFIDAQAASYETALAEIKNGRKRSHWMWYIFPQIQGLGFSETAKYYAIVDLDEARAFLAHPVLGQRLVRISEALLGLESNDANRVLGSPDDVKLKSSMTLFAALDGNPVFRQVLDKFFRGAADEKTLRIVNPPTREAGPGA